MSKHIHTMYMYAQYITLVQYYYKFSWSKAFDLQVYSYTLRVIWPVWFSICETITCI